MTDRRGGDRTIGEAPETIPHVAGFADRNSHVVQFFEGDDALIDAATTFVGDALAAGGIGIVVATGSHREHITARLRQQGLLSPSADDEGRFVALDAQETLNSLMIDGAIDAGRVDAVLGPLLAWAANTGRRVRVFGEMVALLAAQGNHAATIALEQGWNALQQSYPFMLLCAYPLQQLGTEAEAALFQDICDTHDHVIPAESYHGLTSETDRWRTVAALQQKAQRLEAEIVERRHAEERLRQALQEAEDALRLRDEILSVAAHELRNPLAGLSLHTQLAQYRLAREGTVEPQRLTQTLAAIAGQANRLSTFVERLLDVSRLSAGQLALEPHVIDLAALVNKISAQMAVCRDDRQIAVTTPPGLEAHADAARLEQVLVNLLDNAIKFSPPESAIEVTLSAPHPGIAELSVRDHGRGIPLEARAHLFERYSQAHRDGAVAGLGLGLWVSRQIVQLHGGQVRAEFPPDGGTRIVVTLPLVADSPITFVAD